MSGGGIERAWQGGERKAERQRERGGGGKERERDGGERRRLNEGEKERENGRGTEKKRKRKKKDDEIRVDEPRMSTLFAEFTHYRNILLVSMVRSGPSGSVVHGAPRTESLPGKHPLRFRLSSVPGTTR